MLVTAVLGAFGAIGRLAWAMALETIIAVAIVTSIGVGALLLWAASAWLTNFKHFSNNPIARYLRRRDRMKIERAAQ